MDDAAALMGPPPDDFFEAIEVSDRVNKVKNDDASVQQPAGCEPDGIVETDVRRSTDQLDLF
ncbi:MAG: hypothetical protein K8F25_08615 [Fimbriimonadaceae bacterium]|nr:hypothetical protein [Alphaproteobacteria bacterium]